MGWYALSDAQFGVFILLKVNTRQNVSYTWLLCVLSQRVLFLTSSNNLGSVVHQCARASVSPFQPMRSEQMSNSHIYNVKRISKFYKNFHLNSLVFFFEEILLMRNARELRPYIEALCVCLHVITFATWFKLLKMLMYLYSKAVPYTAVQLQ